MKVITICGSLKFQKEIMKISEKLELAGNCVLPPIYPTREDKDDYTEAELAVMGQMHYEKIKMSDAIFVINVENYIGESTKKEISYAESLGKEVLYYTDYIKE